MTKLLRRFKQIFFKILIKIPFLNSYSSIWYLKLGVKGIKVRISTNITIIGEYNNIELADNVEINSGCFLVAKEKIRIGKNSTLAYQTTILTSADPNGPHNLLYKIYGSIKKPVIIGDNTWIGARAVILPGVTIGNCRVVAAGSVVIHDIPDYSLVAGVPAIEIKKLDKKKLINNDGVNFILGTMLQIILPSELLLEMM